MNKNYIVLSKSLLHLLVVGLFKSVIMAKFGCRVYGFLFYCDHTENLNLLAPKAEILRLPFFVQQETKYY